MRFLTSCNVNHYKTSNVELNLENIIKLPYLLLIFFLIYQTVMGNLAIIMFMEKRIKLWIQHPFRKHEQIRHV